MSPDQSSAPTTADVVVVGGGPAGCSAGVFTGRYGLETVVFDRGPAALPRCAYLENYLGFPAGLDVETVRDLMHAHAEEAGCAVVPETVASVERAGDGPRGFVVETRTGRRVTTDRVVAAAWYDGSYLRPLDDDRMFEERERDGDRDERFDPGYPDADGRTPIEGLYVAAPSGDRNAQAIVAAGHGAHVARCLLADHRRERGYAGETATYYDWARPASQFTGEWADRDRWRERFDAAFDADAASEDRRVELRERDVDRTFEARLSGADAEARARRGVRRLVEVLGPERVLEAVDDEAIRQYAGVRLAPDDE